MPSWTFCVPQLPVHDVAAAQAWYRDVLGLEINWLWEDTFGSVGQECVELYLYESADRHPVYVSIFVADVDEVHARIVASGGDVVGPLEDKPWNIREFTVRDPDGHLLRIGSPVEGEPAAELSFPGRVEA